MNFAAQDQKRPAFGHAKREGGRGPQTAGSATAHLLHIFPSFGLGGVPIRISSIVNHLGQRYRHTIVALDSCLDCRVRIDPEIDADFQVVASSGYGLISDCMLFRRHIHRISPELLLTYNWGAIEWALANNLAPICPNIHLESGFNPEEADDQIAIAER